MSEILDQLNARLSVLVIAASALAAGGCGLTSVSEPPAVTAPKASRRIVALGRIEPTGGVVSISALPGERLERFAPGVVAGASVPAGGELAWTSSFDLRQTQLDAAELKLHVARQQRRQELAAAQAQLEQALAAQSQAEAKLRETLAQERTLQNLSEAAAIAQEDYEHLAALQADDPELVTEHQLRRRHNASDRAIKEYEAAAAAYPAALAASRKSVAAAEANVQLARQNLELVQKVDHTRVAALELEAAEETRDQSILRVPDVEGGPSEFAVLRTLLQPGEFIAQIPVLEIADLGRMSCVAEVYEADAKEIRPGQRATIRSPAFSGKFADDGLPGKVTQIGSMVVSPGLTNRNPLAPSDRSIVEVAVAIDSNDQQAVAEAAKRVGLQVTVEFLSPSEAVQKPEEAPVN